jgi:GAF domain-containing protein
MFLVDKKMSGLSSGNSGTSESALLQSVVEVARSVFGAAAASVFLLDAGTGDLVFAAVSGEGEGELVGARFPRGTGIAGWVAQFGQPVLVDDVSESPDFARDAAELTGYVPVSIMAAPLIRDGDTVGVLEVLDRGRRPRGDLGDVDLLGLLATELALSLDLLVRLRWAQQREITPAGQPESGADLALLRRVAERLPGADAAVAVAVTRLLAAADELLAGSVHGQPG